MLQLNIIIKFDRRTKGGWVPLQQSAAKNKKSCLLACMMNITALPKANVAGICATSTGDAAKMNCPYQYKVHTEQHPP